MPFTLDWDPAGVCRGFAGEVSIEERLRSFTAICGDPHFDDLRCALTDDLQVTSYEVTEAATREVAALHVAPLRTNPRIAIAALATRPDIVAAIEHVRGLQMVTQPYGVFSTEAAARLWLQAAASAPAGAVRPWGY